MRDTTEIPYEDRIAQLEAKIATLEATLEAGTTRTAFSWKSWFERYGLIVA